MNIVATYQRMELNELIRPGDKQWISTLNANPTLAIRSFQLLPFQHTKLLSLLRNNVSREATVSCRLSSASAGQWPQDKGLRLPRPPADRVLRPSRIRNTFYCVQSEDQGSNLCSQTCKCQLNWTKYNQRLTRSSSGSRATKAGSHQRTRTTGMTQMHSEPFNLILSLSPANAVHLVDSKRPVTKNWQSNVSAIFCWTMHTKTP